MAVTLIVDGANVMGSRADGWWRDPPGAMARLHGDLAGLADRGIPGSAPGASPDWPDAPGGPDPDMPGGSQSGDRWFPEVVLVVEGRARAVVDLVSSAPGVEVVAARGEGDDTIAKLAGQLPGQRIVVTADRELRRRCEAAGAAVTGPRWLTGLFS
jgi:8-oxo-dGTP diphosphatase